MRSRMLLLTTLLLLGQPAWANPHDEPGPFVPPHGPLFPPHGPLYPPHYIPPFGPGPYVPHHYPPLPPAPGMVVNVLPMGYETIMVAGLTYFVLNSIWYQPQGDHYVVVNNPGNTTTTTITTTRTSNTATELTPVDINGVRYYVQEGHYYRRSVDGQYLEVTPPK